MPPFSIRRHVWNRVKATTPKVVRVSLFLAAAYVVAMLFVARGAKADLTEILMGLGPEMMRYDEATSQDAPRTLFLNGARVRFASGMTQRTVRDVLDYYERRCAERGGELDAQLRELARDDAGRPVPESIDTSAVDATIRQDGDDKGFVACLDLGRDRLDPRAVVSRFTDFLDSGDLSKVGHMRYVFARRARDGGAHFVAFWSEGELNLMRMFPPTGDAPGQDPQGLPRPRGARRLLSAWEEGHPASMTIYGGTREAAPALERWYRQRLERDEWRVLDRHGRATRVEGTPLDDTRAMVVERGDSMATVVVSTDPEGRGVATVLVSR